MSTQTYALMFYGFPVGNEDIIDQAFSDWQLEEHITKATLGHQVRLVSYGPFDDYSYALAIRKPFIKVDADSRIPLVAVPLYLQQGHAKQAGWDEQLRMAAEILGVVFKQPRWYLAPWRF